MPFLNVAHAAYDEWVLSAYDKATKAPVPGVTMKFFLWEGSYKNRNPLAECVTGPAGTCSVFTERESYVLYWDPTYLYSAVEAYKKGFERVRPQKATHRLHEGKAYITVHLNKYPLTVFSVKDLNGAPLESVDVWAKDAAESSCTTGSDGECSVQLESASETFSVKKAGYVDFQFSKPVPAGEKQTVTLKTLAQVKREVEEKEKAEKEERETLRRIHLEMVRESPNTYICAAYGRIVRKEGLERFKYFDDGDEAAVLEEVKRRKITVNQKLVEGEKLKMGMSDCELLASWGYPEDINRSVGSWGTHVQYVYRSLKTYVYTRNGKVTSWQD